MNEHHIKIERDSLFPFRLAKMRLQGIDPLKGFKEHGVLSKTETVAMFSIAYRHNRMEQAYDLLSQDTAWEAIETLLSNPKISAMVDDYKTPITPRVLESEKLDASGKLSSALLEFLRANIDSHTDVTFDDPSRFEEDLLAAYSTDAGIELLKEISKQSKNYYKREAVINLAANPFDRDLKEEGRRKAIENFREYYDDHHDTVFSLLSKLCKDIDWTDPNWIVESESAGWWITYDILNDTDQIGLTSETTDFSVETLHKVSEKLSHKKAVADAATRAAVQKRQERAGKVSRQINDCRTLMAADTSRAYQDGWSEEEKYRDGGEAQLSRLKLESWASMAISRAAISAVRKFDEEAALGAQRDFRQVALPKVRITEGKRFEAIPPYISKTNGSTPPTQKTVDEFPLEVGHPLTTAFSSSVDEEELAPMRATTEIEEVIRESIRNSINRITLEFDTRAVASAAATKINEILSNKTLLNGRPRSLSAENAAQWNSDIQAKVGTDLMEGILDLQRCENITQFVAAVVAGSQAAEHINLDAACHRITSDPQHRKSLMKLVQGSGQRIATEDGRTVVGRSKIPLETLLSTQIYARLHSQNLQERDWETYGPLLEDADRIGEAAWLVALRAVPQDELENAHAAKLARQEEWSRGPSSEVKRTDTATTASKQDIKTQKVQPGMVEDGPRRPWFSKIFG